VLGKIAYLFNQYALFADVSGELCHWCVTQTSLADCRVSLNCGVGSGCFSQTWVTGQLRYCK